jgi:hypothetical protein
MQHIKIKTWIELLLLSRIRFCPQIHYGYVNSLQHLKCHTLCTRRHHLEAPFCHCLQWAYTHILSFIRPVVSSSRCPSARCAPAANTVAKDVDVFNKQVVTRKDILKLHCVYVCSLRSAVSRCVVQLGILNLYYKLFTVILVALISFLCLCCLAVDAAHYNNVLDSVL